MELVRARRKPGDSSTIAAFANPYKTCRLLNILIRSTSQVYIFQFLGSPGEDPGKGILGRGDPGKGGGV